MSKIKDEIVAKLKAAPAGTVVYYSGVFFTSLQGKELKKVEDLRGRMIVESPSGSKHQIPYVVLQLEPIN